MTRKDYEALAKWIKGLPVSDDLKETIAITLAEQVLSPDNPRFNGTRFAEVVSNHDDT